MSQQVTEAFVQQYNSNVIHLSQQKGSMLEPYVRRESQKGKSQFFDRIGPVAAVKRTGRHADTPQIDTPHSRRMVTIDDYEWADLVDDQDKIRMLIDPTSEYVLAAAWAFGRSKDDVIIASAFGSAYAGDDGKTVVAHPNADKYAANDGAVFTNLNVRTLRAIRRMLKKNLVDKSLQLHIAVTSSQTEAMLGQIEVTNSDYNTVKALVQGEVDSYMGFKFHELERINLTTSTTATAASGVVGAGVALAGTNRAVIAWAEGGLLMSVGEDVMSRISERPDKGYAMQPYTRMSIGATRMEEEKVIEVICKEA